MSLSHKQRLTYGNEVLKCIAILQTDLPSTSWIDIESMTLNDYEAITTCKEWRDYQDKIAENKIEQTEALFKMISSGFNAITETIKSAAKAFSK